MTLQQKIKLAYLVGCKMAAVNNANDLVQHSMDAHSSINKKTNADDSSRYGNIMQNGEIRQQTEAGTQYGPKSQMAINPEWTGP